jgi:hypothetical protein
MKDTFEKNLSNFQIFFLSWFPVFYLTKGRHLARILGAYLITAQSFRICGFGGRHFALKLAY